MRLGSAQKRVPCSQGRLGTEKVTYEEEGPGMEQNWEVASMNWGRRRGQRVCRQAKGGRGSLDRIDVHRLRLGLA